MNVERFVQSRVIYEPHMPRPCQREAMITL
jgi:hypothetical protein